MAIASLLPQPFTAVAGAVVVQKNASLRATGTIRKTPHSAPNATQLWRVELEDREGVASESSFLAIRYQ